MKQHKQITENQIIKASREPLISQGINIGNFNIDDWLKNNSDQVTENGIFVIWNDGKPKVNTVGGQDVISWLYKDNNIICGWSR